MPETKDQNAVTLRVNGKIYSGWTSVQIECSVNSLARGCKLKAMSSPTGVDLCGDINCGDEAVVSIGNDRVLTGYVVAKDLKYSEKDLSADITIKSRTIDLEECTFPPDARHSWNGFTVKDIVASMCGNCSIEVVAKVDAGKKINSDASVHETVGGEIKKLLTKESLLVMDDEYGRLVICHAGSNGKAGDALQTGKNVLSGQRTHDVSGVFSEYVTIGQGRDVRSEKSTPANALRAKSDNSAFPRRRVKVYSRNGDQTLEKLKESADNLRNISIAKSDKLIYKIQGWRQSSGALWRANMSVVVNDPYFFGKNEQILLISKITYSIDSHGTVATIEAMAPEAFLVMDDGKEAEKKKAAAKKKTGTAKGTTFLARRGTGKI